MDCPHRIRQPSGAMAGASVHAGFGAAGALRRRACKTARHVDAIDWEANPFVDNQLYEMSLCERAARTGLQIPLKCDGARLVRELDRSDQFPGTEAVCMDRTAGIVYRDPSTDVGCEAHVVSSWLRRASNDVDVLTHARCECKNARARLSPRNARLTAIRSQFSPSPNDRRYAVPDDGPTRARTSSLACPAEAPS